VARYSSNQRSIGECLLGFPGANGIYQGRVTDWVSDGHCYKGFIEGWGAEGGHGEYESDQKCAPCFLFTETYGEGSISGAPIGKSTHNCGAGISLTAQPSSGWHFTNWGGSISSQSPSLAFTLDASKSLTAFFDQLPPTPPPQYTTCVQSNNECQDPLILDLNGDGIHTTGVNEPVWFDMDGDGLLEQTAWTNAATGEGFLYLDLDHKGRVTNGGELFGVGTVMPDGSRGRDGFAALAVYDGNGDGVVDANDDVWNRLRIWVDANHDGICDPGETGPIHKYGVREIQIAAVTSNVVDEAGNLHKLSSVFHRKNREDAIQAIGFQRVR